MELQQFMQDKAGCYSDTSDFYVWEVRNSDFLRDIDMPDVHIQLFITRGSINATINGRTVILRSDSLIDVLHHNHFCHRDLFRSSHEEQATLPDRICDADT